MELVPIESVVMHEEEKLGGRSLAIHSVAKRLNVTVATLYRWIGTGDHFVCDEEDMSFESVFKLVKCVEK